MHATTRITNTLTVHNIITVIDTWMQWVCWGMTMTMNGTENTVLSFHQFHEHQWMDGMMCQRALSDERQETRCSVS